MMILLDGKDERDRTKYLNEDGRWGMGNSSPTAIVLSSINKLE